MTIADTSTPTEKSRRSRRFFPDGLSAVALGLTLAAALMLAALMPRLFQHWQACRAFPFQLDAEEGFILNQALTLARGGSIYHSLAHPPFLVGNYPPLLPWLASLLTGTRATPFSLPAGRALIQASALLAALALAAVAALRTRRLAPALLAPLLFLSTYEVYHWAGFVRVDLPALALTLAGLGVFLTVRPRWGVALAAVLFVAAGFTRQTALLAPAACAAALLFSDRRRFVLFMAVYAGLGLALLGLAQAFTDGEFWRHVVTYNRNRLDWTGWSRVMKNELWFFYRWWIAALAWWLGMRIVDCGLRNEKEGNAEYHFYELPWTRHATALYLGLAGLSLLSYAKVGAAPNYLLEPLAAAALWSAESLGRALDTLAFATPRRRWLAAAGAWGFCLLLAVHGAGLNGRTRLDGHPLTWSPTPAAADRAAGHALMLALHEAPGEVYCEDPIYTLLAGKTVWHQPFIMAQLAREGRWNERPFLNWIKERKFSLFVVTEDLRGGAARDYERYTPAMAAAVSAHYAPSEVIPLPGAGKNYTLWRPRPSIP